VKIMNAIIAIGLLGLLMIASAKADDALTGLVDPTRPGGERQAGLVLQSTLVSPERKIAVISGRLVSVGESVGRAVVTDIKHHEVVLNTAGRETRLRLTPKLQRQPKGNP
jgi:hypothetical protein